MNHGSEPRGLRERKKLKARRELERVAMELFEAKGFDQTTIREIADAADMSPRTFFRYFKSKEEVIFARTSEDVEALKARIRSRPESEAAYVTTRHAIIEWADRLQESKAEIAARVRLLAAAEALRRRAAQVQKDIAREVAAELGRRRSPTQAAPEALVASVCVQVIAAAVMEWTITDVDRPLRGIVREAFDRLEREIRAAPSY